MESYVPYSPEWHLQMDLYATRRERDLFRELLCTVLAAAPDKPQPMDDFTWGRIVRGQDYKETRFSS